MASLGEPTDIRTPGSATVPSRAATLRVIATPWLVWAALSAGGAGAQDESADPPDRVAVLNYASGQVALAPSGGDEWISDVLNRPLVPGDRIWVDDDGRAELHAGSAALRLGMGTALEVGQVDDRIAQFALHAGTVQVHLRHLLEGQRFELDTPSAAVLLNRPGIYRVAVNDVAESHEPQALSVSVLRGSAEVSGATQAFTVGEGQEGLFTGDQLLTAQVGGIPSNDEFDQWAEDRDRHEDAAVTAQYVSREMTGYEALDDYGTWQPYPAYGYVWVPQVAVGWAPFQNGHWVWISPWGWTWVDAAPWGFVPAHYGRWVWIGGRWGWCPGPVAPRPVYAPALVGWVGGVRLGAGFATPGLVAWFPLGWNEAYVPAYRTSPQYFRQINVTNTYLTTTYLNNVYVSNNYLSSGGAGTARYANARVPGAVSAQPQAAFVAAVPVRGGTGAVPEAGLAGAHVLAGAPAIAPETQSRGLARVPPRIPANLYARPLVARSPVPAARLPFTEQARVVAANGGRPVPVAQLAAPNRPAAPARVVVPAAQAPPAVLAQTPDRVYQPRTYADRPPYAGRPSGSNGTNASATARPAWPTERTAPQPIPESSPRREQPAPAHLLAPPAAYRPEAPRAEVAPQPPHRPAPARSAPATSTR
jgi:hypothetical protein